MFDRMANELEMTVVNVHKESFNRTRNLLRGSFSSLRGLPPFKLDEDAGFPVAVASRVRFVSHADNTKLNPRVRACAEWSWKRILLAPKFGP